MTRGSWNLTTFGWMVLLLSKFVWNGARILMTQKILAHAYFFFRRKLVELESTLRVPTALSFSTHLGIHLRISKVYSESTGRKPQKFSHVLSFFNFPFFMFFRLGKKKPCYVYLFFARGTMEEKVYYRQVKDSTKILYFLCWCMMNFFIIRQGLI